MDFDWENYKIHKNKLIRHYFNVSVARFKSLGVNFVFWCIMLWKLLIIIIIIF